MSMCDKRVETNTKSDLCHQLRRMTSFHIVHHQRASKVMLAACPRLCTSHSLRSSNQQRHCPPHPTASFASLRSASVNLWQLHSPWLAQSLLILSLPDGQLLTIILHTTITNTIYDSSPCLRLCNPTVVSSKNTASCSKPAMTSSAVPMAASTPYNYSPSPLQI